MDFNRRLVTVEGRNAKNRQTRHVPLNDEAISVLQFQVKVVAPLSPVGCADTGGSIRDRNGNSRQHIREMAVRRCAWSV